MSKLVLTDANVAIAAIDASAYTRAVRIDLTDEEIDITPLGADMHRQTMGGQRTAQVTLDVFSGLAPLEQALRTAYDAGSSVDVQLRPHDTIASSANPSWTVPCVITAWAPFGGGVGEASKALIRLATAGDVTIDAPTLEALVLGSVLVVG